MTDRDKIIKGLEKCKRHECDDCAEKGASQAPWDCPVYDDFVDSAIALLKEQPEIVRCKDCKHLEHMYILDELNGKKCYVCRKHPFTGLRDENWFCADGERR